MPSITSGERIVPALHGSGLLVTAFCALLLLFTAGCSRQAAPPAAMANGPMGGAGAGAPQAVGVVTAAAGMSPLGIEIEAIGSAVANESAEITSRTVNTVTAIRFTEGQFVRKGDVLIEFDSAQARADLAGAEAALAESRSQYKRSRELYATKALSEAQLDQLEATLKSNEARVAAAAARLADTVIRAPFAGHIGFRRISVGGLVSPGTVICTLDDTSIIKLDFTVPQTQVFAIAPGLPVSARIAGIPNRTFTGRVTTLATRVDPVTRSIMVRAELPNPEGILKPGMFMSAKLSAAEAPALLIPEGALVPEQGKMFVFVVKDGVASKREVTIGQRRPGEVQVTTGLSDGERVVVEGTQKIRDGVQVLEIDPATSLAVS